MKEKGRRYNKGKLRYELFPPFAKKAIVEVYTKGAHKYSIYKDKEGNLIKGMDIPFEDRGKYELVDDASGNWRNGFSWTETLASIKRHEAAFEIGEDFDPELLTYHAANAAWGWISILEFYKIYPQGDDRKHPYLQERKIGLDIDGVLADFVGHLMEVTGNKGHVPEHWNDPIVRREFDKVKKDENFWKNIPPLLKREDIPFEPHCYITARSISSEVTQEWLDRHLFPKASLYCVGVGESKVEIARQSGITHFVDDSYSNFLELSRAGIFTYLYTAPYNKKYDVGYKRISSLKELI